jgi:hypothetical protein
MIVVYIYLYRYIYVYVRVHLVLTCQQCAHRYKLVSLEKKSVHDEDKAMLSLLSLSTNTMLQ